MQTVAIPSLARPLLEALSIEPMADEIVLRVFEGPFLEHKDDQALVGAVADSARANLAAFKLFVAGILDIESFLPSRTLELVSLQAQLEISESEVQEAFRLGAGVVLEVWTATVGDSGMGIAEAADAIRALATGVLAWQDQLLETVSAALAAESEAMSAPQASVRQQLLRQVLAGERVATESELSSALLYDMMLHHCAIILPDCPPHRVREDTHPIRRAVDALGYMSFPLGAAGTALWLGRLNQWTPRVTALLRATLEGQQVRAAIGRPGRGISGFVQSFRDAERAESVRQLWSVGAPTVVVFDDVGLDALFLTDLDSARQFVETELGPLAADTQDVGKLLETVMVWFQTGSHVSAAATLGLHEHTVRNRVGRVEKLIGHPLTSRRTELEVALRLHRILGGPDHAAAPPRS